MAKVLKSIEKDLYTNGKGLANNMLMLPIKPRM
jgi:hypothetical protein